MEVLTLPVEARRPVETPLAAPSVRVRRSGETQTQRFEFVDGKCTIGSSPRCQVCLPAADARPLHCLLALDEGNVVATRWATGVQLNGREFTKALLGAGDRLAIGSWVIDVDLGRPDDATGDDGGRLADDVTSTAFSPATEQRYETGDETTGADAEVPVAMAPAFEAVTGLQEPQPRNQTPQASASDATEPIWPVLEADQVDIGVTLPPTPTEADGDCGERRPSDEATPDDLSPAVQLEHCRPEGEPETTPAPTVVSATTSQLFADRIVLELWTANHQARRRAKSLINAIRAARFQADALVADMSAMETELDLARAAYDSQTESAQRIQQDVLEERRRADERVAPLIQEVSELYGQLEAARVNLKQQTAEYDVLAAELAAIRDGYAQAAASANDETRRARERESDFKGQNEELEKVRDELQAAQIEIAATVATLAERTIQWKSLQEELASCRNELIELGDPHRTERVRTADLEQQLANIAEQRIAGLTSPNTDETQNSWAELSPHSWPTPTAEVSGETTGDLKSTANWSAPAAPQSIDDSEEATSANDWARPTLEEPRSIIWGEATAADRIEQSAVDAQTEDSPRPTDFFRPAPAPPEFATSQREQAPTEATTPLAESATSTLYSASVEAPIALGDLTPDLEQPATEFSTPSFIDKYRHLLDEDPVAPMPRPLHAGRPMLDDEFLSPAKAPVFTALEDDSDEALEAYMKNMMRRVRDAGGSVASSQAPPAEALSVAKNFMSSGGKATPTTDAAHPFEPSIVDDESLEPFDITSMKQPGRKLLHATDLTAMRELANSTARTAINVHRQKRYAESAIGKIVLAVASNGAAAYLLHAAPTMESWWFWAGVVSAGVGTCAAIQVLRIERWRAGTPAAIAAGSAHVKVRDNVTPVARADSPVA